MNLGEWLRVVAVLLSPLIALQVSQILQRRRDARDRKTKMFRTLMATRASRLSPGHVEALNMIDIEFHDSGRKGRAVLLAWKAYLDHLNNAPPPASPSMEQWYSRGEDLFVDLLFAMGQTLGYDFDRTHIRRTSYLPTGHGQIEDDQHAIRKGVVALLQGRVTLPVCVLSENEAPTVKPLSEIAPTPAGTPPTPKLLA